MANALYGKGREAFLNGSIDWETDDIRIFLIDTTHYNVDIDVHWNTDSIPSAAVVRASDALASKTVALGVADAADITFYVVTGDTCEAIIIYKYTGIGNTALLIAYIDSATGLPVTPNGGDIVCQWNSGANKIFKL